MGVDAGDYNADGLPDLIVTNFSHDYNTCTRTGLPASSRTVVTRPASPQPRARIWAGASSSSISTTTAGSMSSSPTGMSIPKWIVTASERGTGSASRCSSTRGDRFRHATSEIGGGLLLEQSSRGAAFGDYDNDGDVDVLVINMNERPTLLRNDTPQTNHWITIRLIGAKSNRSAIGASVRIDAGGRQQIAGSAATAAISRTATTGTRWPRRCYSCRSSGDSLAERAGRNATGLAADRFYVAQKGRGSRLRREPANPRCDPARR